MSSQAYPINIQVAFTGPVSIDDPSVLAGAVRSTLYAHLVRPRPQPYRQAMLTVTVLACEVNHWTGSTRIELEVNGHVNGRPVNRKCRSVEQFAAGGGLRKFSLAGTFADGIAAIARTAEGSGPLEQYAVGRCLRNCLADVCMAIDRAAGVAETDIAMRWRIVLWLRGILGLFLPLLGVAIVNAREPKELSKGMEWVIAAFAAISAFFLVHCIGLLTMPTRFFLEEPRGQKALARCGVTSPDGARVVCGLLAVVLLFVLGCCFWAFCFTK